jgi:hypothetical protein
MHVRMFLLLCVFQILWKAFVALACDERATVLLSDPDPGKKCGRLDTCSQDIISGID